MRFRSSRIQWLGLSMALSAPLVFVAVAEPQGPDAAVVTMHAEARVVQIEVVVTDSHGRPATDLSRQDFAVSDAGKPRAIDIFSVEHTGGVREQAAPWPESATQALQPGVFSNRHAGPPDLPGHATVIVLDQVNAYLEDAAYAREQVLALLKKVPADERIALYVIARKQGLAVLQEYTADHALIMKSLSRWAPRGIFPSPAPPATLDSGAGPHAADSSAAARPSGAANT